MEAIQKVKVSLQSRLSAVAGRKIVPLRMIRMWMLNKRLDALERVLRG